MNKIKIGLVLPDLPGYSETFFTAKIQGLGNEGYKITLFVGAGNRTFPAVKVKSAWKIYKSNVVIQALLILIACIYLLFTAPKHMLRFIRVEREDNSKISDILKSLYINVHILSEKLDWLHFGFGTMAINRENVAKAIGAKMAVSFRGFDINVYPLKAPLAYKKVWEKVDKVHSISDDLYRKALSLGLKENIPYEKITPAIDLNKFYPGTINWGRKIKILTVARLHWVKGIEYALHAISLLEEMNLKVQMEYTVVGNGPEYERLLYASYQLGIQDKVVFLGRKSSEEIAEIMRAHHIYLQPSIEEGFCNAVLEAQASGMLCIASDTGGLAENIVQGQTGWKVQKRDPTSIANAIKKLIGMSPEARNFIQKNALQRVESRFSIDDQIKTFKKFYENALPN